MPRVNRSRKPATDDSTSPLFPDLPAPASSVPAPKVRASHKTTGLPRGLDSDDYEFDEDGLLREKVGGWVRDKHARLALYVGISSSVRKNWVKRGPAGATYVDLFSGPGRVRIRETSDVLDGSPLIAWNQSVKCKAPFTHVYVADAHSALCGTVVARLKRAKAPVESDTGKALETVDRIINKVDKYSLHFAFLDPYNLEALPFEVIRKLASLEHMDILIHVSLQDLNRNLRKYVSIPNSPLDTFAPGWQRNLDLGRPHGYLRAKIFEHWRGLLQTVRMKTAEAAEVVSGPNNQPLYWLAFAARHDRALEFWEKIRRLKPDPQSGLL